jgi:hypothetical protein
MLLFLDGGYASYGDYGGGGGYMNNGGGFDGGVTGMNSQETGMLCCCLSACLWIECLSVNCEEEK